MRRAFGHVARVGEEVGIAFAFDRLRARTPGWPAG